MRFIERRMGVEARAAGALVADGTTLNIGKRTVAGRVMEVENGSLQLKSMLKLF